MKKAHPARRGRPINSWIPGDARVAPLRCPILRLRQHHYNKRKHVNHPLTDESVSGIGCVKRTMREYIGILVRFTHPTVA
jgi:hypothetical protein